MSTLNETLHSIEYPIINLWIQEDLFKKLQVLCTAQRLCTAGYLVTCELPQVRAVLPFKLVCVEQAWTPDACSPRTCAGKRCPEWRPALNQSWVLCTRYPVVNV